MSHRPIVQEVLDERLSEKTRAVLLRIGRLIADGFEGEIQLMVGKGGGIRYMKRIITETGDTIREDLG